MTFWKVSDFPRLSILEEKWEEIASEIPVNGEITQVRQQNEWNENLVNFLSDWQQNQTWVQSWNKGWYNFPLIHQDQELTDSCPKTMALLKEIGGINIAGFSLLEPETQLISHTDTTGPDFGSMAFNMLLRGENSFLWVKPAKRFLPHEHQLGKAVIFNAQQTHFATNNSTSDRVILYLDFKK